MIKALPNLVIILLYFFSFPIQAQVCSSGMAGSYPCSNIDLQAYINLSSSGLNATSSNDIWGWTASDGSEYAIIGLYNGTSFIDVTNPASPIILGKLNTHSTDPNGVGHTWRDIKVVNDYAYIGSEIAGHGIQIFNLNNLTTVTNPPVTFTEDGWIDLPSSNDRSHNLAANDVSDYIYAVGTHGTLNNGGLTFYNVANPTSPIHEGGYGSSGYSHDALCITYRGPDVTYTGSEICFGFNNSVVAISDVSNKSNPAFIKSFSYPGNDYCHQGWITDDHKYLLLDDELDETGPTHTTRTYIFDISDLNNPVHKYTYNATNNAIDHNLYVKGPYAYLSNYTSGLRILDISDLDNNMPTEVAYFDNYPPHNNGNFDGSWSVYPYFKSGNVVMSNIDGAYGGLHVVTPNLSHYVMEVLNAGVESVCQGDQAVFSFENKAYSGFSTNDNITITGVPNGATATLSSNPVPPNGTFTLTIGGTSAVALGSYNIILTGTEIPVNRVSVGLTVTAANGGLPNVVLVSPPDQAIGQPLTLNFDWNPVSGATLYDLEVAYDNSFNNIAFSAYDLSSTQFTFQGLEGASVYYWRVLGKDNNCATSSGYDVWRFSTIDNPVPVELLNFSASPQKESILLNWQTASEVGSAGFEIQRSGGSPNTDFRKIAWVDSQSSNSNSLKAYRYEDGNVIPGIQYYYRLRQVDLDGKDELSEVVNARLSEEQQGLTGFPNPANDEMTIQLKKALSNENITLSIYNTTGRLIFTQKVSSESIKNGYQLNINDLAKGTYLLSLENNQVNESMRFLKW